MNMNGDDDGEIVRRNREIVRPCDCVNDIVILEIRIYDPKIVRKHQKLHQIRMYIERRNVRMYFNLA